MGFGPSFVQVFPLVLEPARGDCGSCLVGFRPVCSPAGRTAPGTNIAETSNIGSIATTWLLKPDYRA